MVVARKKATMKKQDTWRMGHCRWEHCPDRDKEQPVWPDGFCSNRCRQQARAAHPDRIPAAYCRNCGKPLRKPPVGPTPDWCGPKCRNLWNREHSLNGTGGRCLECGEPIPLGQRGPEPVYCSRNCAKRHRRKERRDKSGHRIMQNADMISRLETATKDLSTRTDDIVREAGRLHRQDETSRTRTGDMIARMLMLATRHAPDTIKDPAPDGFPGRLRAECDQANGVGTSDRIIERNCLADD